MSDYEGYSPGQILADASVADFIGSLGLSIADAQRQLDENSLSLVDEYTRPRQGLNNQSLLQLGLVPAFYHYQYADLSCQMDLRLRVTNSLEVGGSAYYQSGSDTSGNSSNSDQETFTSSGTEDRAHFRDAALRVKASTASAININGKAYAASGNSAQEKIDDLLDKITSDSESGIDMLLYTLEQPTSFTITTDAPAANVTHTARTITIKGGEHTQGIIRISQNQATDFTLNATANQTLTVNSLAKDTIDLYAAHVLAEIKSKGFDAQLIDKNAQTPFASVFFDTGRDSIRSAIEHNKIRALADYLIKSGETVVIEGFADRQLYRGETPPSSENLNIALGNRRAERVRDTLKALGVANGQIEMTLSRGQAEADLQQPTGPLNNQDYRRVSMTVAGRNQYWILVSAKPGGPSLTGVTPPVDDADNTLTGTSNRFIFLRGASTLNLAGNKVTIDSKEYALRGDAVDGFAANTAEAYARNLALDINAATGINYSASASQNVVTLIGDADEFSVVMASSANFNLAIRETDGVRITKQFTYTAKKSSSSSSKNSKKVAVGATVDARYKRSFELDVTGNSKISARLVSIPAPPEFLTAISAYLATVGTGDSGPIIHAPTLPTPPLTPTPPPPPIQPPGTTVTPPVDDETEDETGDDDEDGGG